MFKISFGCHKVSIHFLYALHKALYYRHDFVSTSSRHRQDITITPPTHPDISLLHGGGSPTIADSQNTSLTVVHVAQIIPRIFPCPSPNIWRHFGDTSPNIPLRIINTLRVCFLVGSHVQYRHRSSPERVFFIASTSPDILALVGP